jgi:tetratricopeptide (TPR) repeat protein
MMHRFAEARLCLARAATGGATTEDVQHLSLTVDQACGVNLDKVLDARREMANRFDRLEDLVALGSLRADMGEWDDADRTYRRALRAYQDVSPFPLAWVYFQLGALWGELVPRPRPSHAAEWYRRAIDILPRYAKAAPRASTRRTPTPPGVMSTAIGWFLRLGWSTTTTLWLDVACLPSGCLDLNVSS